MTKLTVAVQMSSSERVLFGDGTSDEQPIVFKPSVDPSARIDVYHGPLCGMDVSWSLPWLDNRNAMYGGYVLGEKFESIRSSIEDIVGRYIELSTREMCKSLAGKADALQRRSNNPFYPALSGDATYEVVPCDVLERARSALETDDESLRLIGTLRQEAETDVVFEPARPSQIAALLNPSAATQYMIDNPQLAASETLTIPQSGSEDIVATCSSNYTGATQTQLGAMGDMKFRWCTANFVGRGN